MRSFYSFFRFTLVTVVIIGLKLSVFAQTPGEQSTNAYAENHRALWQQLNSKSLHIFPEHEKRSGSTPALVSWFFRLISWDPKGMSQNASCEKLAKEWSNFSDLDLYFEACEEKIADQSILSQFFGLRTLAIALNAEQNPLIRRVQFQLDSGIKVSGLLGLKDFDRARPLVILRLGIFGQADEMQAETFIYKMLFEQSYYNILVLDNSSNVHFLIDNPEHLSFAGYDEGLQNLNIAKLFRNSNEPIARLISSIHLVGVSLGGHGVLYANIKNEESQKPIDSFMAFCPLVQFAETLEYHRLQNNLVNYFANFWGRMRLEQFLKDKENRFVKDSQILPALTDFVAEEYAKNSEDKKIFFSNNDFLKKGNFSEEILIFASQEDRLVPFNLNAGWLRDQQKEGHYKKAIIQPLKYSFHCAIPDHYFWASWSNLLNSYVEHRSPNLKFAKESIKKLIPGLSSDEVSQLRKSIRWNKEQKKFEVFIQFFSQSRPFDVRYLVPAASLDFAFNASQPTKSEVSMALRWLYKNLDFYVDKTKSTDRYMGILEVKTLE